MSDKKPKKKFKDTKVGSFLLEKAPSILGVVGDVLPDAGVLGIVKGLIEKEPAAVLPPEDKEKALKLLIKSYNLLYTYHSVEKQLLLQNLNHNHLYFRLIKVSLD